MIRDNRDIRLFGLPFFSGTTREAVARISGLAGEKGAGTVAAVNVFLVTECRRSRALAEFYEKCDLVTVDGRPLVYASRLLSRRPFPEMVGGPNLWTELLRFAAREGRTVYFLGSTGAILEKARARTAALFPGLRVAGMHDGYFELESPECEKVVEDIRRTGPDLVYIGMPTPKKEILADRLGGALDRGVLVLIGGAFDYFAGEKKIEREWVSRLCLGWFFRMLQEPHRLFLRYLGSNSRFMLLLFKELLNKNRD